MTGNGIDVLVIGAGTTGLTTALHVHAAGGRVRIVDRRSELFRPSRAMMMHPRTLEVLRPLGITSELLAHGDISQRAEVHLGSRVVSAGLDRFALRGTAFPHLLFIRQADVETVLAEALAARGIDVELRVELLGIEREQEGVVALLRHDGVTQEVFCRYLAACDGPASTTRGILGIPWRGGTYNREVILADLDLGDGFTEGVAHVAVGRRGLLFLFPVGEAAPWRMLATRRTDSSDLPFGQPGPPVSAEVLQGIIDEADLHARIARVVWSAQVPLQHRIASRFRVGPVFLVGDAAHSHSPAGGQGMNAGIQDAANLGWKLAYAARVGARGEEAGTLLDSYERERRPADRRILALTHVLFWAESGTGPIAGFGRGVLAPLAAPALPILMRWPGRMPAAGLRLLSQLSLRYPRSPLSVDGDARGPRAMRAGRRLPDGMVLCRGQRMRLHEIIARPGVHVLLQGDARDLDRWNLGPLVFVHRITNWRGTGVIAVRPDGYIGFRSSVVDENRLMDWLTLVAAV